MKKRLGNTGLDDYKIIWKDTICNGNEHSKLLEANLEQNEDITDEIKLPIIKFKWNYWLKKKITDEDSGRAQNTETDYSTLR